MQSITIVNARKQIQEIDVDLEMDQVVCRPQPVGLGMRGVRDRFIFATGLRARPGAGLISSWGDSREITHAMRTLMNTRGAAGMNL